jgi:battenin
MSFSKDLSKTFGEEKLISSLTGCMNIFGLIVPYFYGKYALKWKHRHKISGVVGLWLSGILLLFIAKKISVFYLVMIGCIFLGLGTTIGGLVILGFLKCFPPIVFAGFSSGTGCAGLFGSLFYLILKMLETPFEFVLAFILLWYPVYYMFFLFLLKIRFKAEISLNEDGINEVMSEGNVEDALSTNVDVANIKSINSSNNNLIEAIPKFKEDLSDFELQEAEINDLITLQNSKQVILTLKYLYFLFFFMYFLEYFSVTILADKVSDLAQTTSKKTDIFSIIQFIYQVGVFAGRSTLDYHKIKNLNSLIFSLLLLVLFLVFQIYFKYILTELHTYVVFFFIGLFGGMGYCNIVYLVISHSKVEKNLKVT